MRGYPFKQQPLQSLTQLVTNAGQRVNTPISGDSFTYWFWLTLTLVFTIAGGPATAVRGNGSGWQAFDIVGLSENGVDVVNADPRVLYYIGQTLATSATTDQRQTSLANGTYTLVSSIPIPLSNWNMMDPGETAYREKNPKGQTFVFAQFSNNAAANMFKLGAATCTFSNALTNIQVTQFHNPNQKKLPLFRPFVRQATQPITGAQAVFPITLFSNRYAGAIVHTMDSNVGLLTDTASAWALRSDLRDYIGPAQQLITPVNLQAQYMAGGDLSVGLGTAGLTEPHMMFDFRYHGQLTTMPEPNETNLRSELNVALSANADATAPIIRTTWWEYERPLDTFQGPNGQPRLVVAPSLPSYFYPQA